MARPVRKQAAASGPDAPPAGLFVTFEGGEGAGKSTQIRLLEQALKKRGFPVLVTREPGGSPGAEAVRHVLLSGAAEPLGPEAEAMLFAAARADHVDTVIRPALHKGIHVLCDRFYDSTRVYQGSSGKVPAALIDRLEAVACGDCRPDLTIIIDVEPAEGLRRAAARRAAGAAPDRFEKEAIALQEKRRGLYRDIARREPDRCAIVDGMAGESALHEEILSLVLQRLAARGTAGRGPVARP
jgi:dTMP kinase